MSLKEIRTAYREILIAYNNLFPPYAVMRKDAEDAMDRFSEDTTDKSIKGGGDLLEISMGNPKKALPTVKVAADQSDNVVSWYRGQSLEGLNQGLRDRIEKALKLGI